MMLFFINALANVDFRSLVTKDVNESMNRVTKRFNKYPICTHLCGRYQIEKDYKCNHDLYKEETKVI